MKGTVAESEEMLSLLDRAKLLGGWQSTGRDAHLGDDLCAVDCVRVVSRASLVVVMQAEKRFFFFFFFSQSCFVSFLTHKIILKTTGI